MQERIAKINSTMLGIEDHGIFTASIEVNYGGVFQAIGNYAFDEYDSKTKDRKGSAFGIDWIYNFLRAASVNAWEKLPGKYIVVLRDDTIDKILGVKQLPPDGDFVFLFKDLADKH